MLKKKEPIYRKKSESKQTVKYSKTPVKDKKSNTTNREEYENGVPCKHEDCLNTMRRLPCRYCGRTRTRGHVIIEDRTGHVYLERLREIDIKLHNELPADVQIKSTLHIFRQPKNSDI